MLADTATSAAAIGDLVLNLGTLAGVVFTVSQMLVWRREYAAKTEEHDRRIADLERMKPVGATEFLEHARRNADSHTTLERALHAASTKASDDLTEEIGKVHEKMNEMGKAVTEVQVETRLQTRMLTAITKELKIPAAA